KKHVSGQRGRVERGHSPYRGACAARAGQPFLAACGPSGQSGGRRTMFDVIARPKAGDHPVAAPVPVVRERSPRTTPIPLYRLALGALQARGASDSPASAAAGRDGAASDAAEAPPLVDDVLRSPGDALAPEVRAAMEPRFGRDFGRVRVHADARAAESAEALGAAAYTVGSDVVFGRGQLAPHTEAGGRLLAHELTHVCQQW